MTGILSLAGRDDLRRGWTSGGVDEAVDGDAELLVLADECPRLAVADDPAVLGGEHALSGRPV
jgi:hypothetical protein